MSLPDNGAGSLSGDTMPDADAAAITLVPVASAHVNQALVDALSQAAANRGRAKQLARQTERLLTETLALRQAITDAHRERLMSPARRELLRRSEQLRLTRPQRNG